MSQEDCRDDAGAGAGKEDFAPARRQAPDLQRVAARLKLTPPPQSLMRRRQSCVG
jgi:hypothetical protein